ncbi:MAG: hypothetical protein LBL09_02535 [Oscillospiraceae bacterium]|nr:hypothetical protein [Oscillospiraceae bacterium]
MIAGTKLTNVLQINASAANSTKLFADTYTMDPTDTVNNYMPNYMPAISADEALRP